MNGPRRPQPATWGDLALPVVGSLWRHANGELYTVDGLSNLGSPDPEHPPTVAYHGRLMQACTRSLTDWHRFMEPASARELRPYHLAPSE